jgi:hypothetical protein
VNNDLLLFCDIDSDEQQQLIGKRNLGALIEKVMIAAGS